MNLSSVHDLLRLISNRITESPSLEYKSQLTLTKRSERRELLKDLSGLANGGGATLIFGIDESEEEDGVPTALTPLDDRGAVGVLEDIVRSGISPPLLYELDDVDAGSGKFALVVLLQRSPLGPYMVHGYGEPVYYTRRGSRTVPMSESEVRDAYALATRQRERRADVWESLQLPLLAPPSQAPWLSSAAVPEEPLESLFNPGTLPTASLRAEHMSLVPPLHAEVGYVQGPTSNPRIWADGVHGDDGDAKRMAGALFRLHKNGAALFALELEVEINPLNTARALNAHLAYLAWLWSTIALRAPVEIDLRLLNLDGTILRDPWTMLGPKDIVPSRPYVGVSPRVVLQRSVLHRQLLDPATRHSVVLEFLSLVYQAFGQRQPRIHFDWGLLYDQRGPMHLAVAGRSILNPDGNEIGRLDVDGRILNSGGHVVAFFRDGVATDLSGDAIAALEFATGSALPTDYRPPEIHESPYFLMEERLAGPLPARHDSQPPAPTRRWSGESLGSLVRSTDAPTDRSN